MSGGTTLKAPSPMYSRSTPTLCHELQLGEGLEAELGGALFAREQAPRPRRR